MKILVTGGTGLVGTSLVAELLRQGHKVRLVSRHASQGARLFDGPVESIDADVASADEIRGTAEACDVIFHNAGIVSEPAGGPSFEEVNVRGTQNIVREAERAGVRRFVYISSLNADKGNSNYHQSKLKGEEVTATFSREWVITRPSVVYGPGDEVVSLLLKMVRTLSAVPVIEGGDQLSQPIWAADLAKALAMCVDRPDVIGETLLLAGPEKVSMNQMLDKLCNLVGKHPVRVPMPGWMAEMGLSFVQRVGVDLPFSQDQIVMLQEGNMLYGDEENALTERFHISLVPLDQRLMELTQSVPVTEPSTGVGKLRHLKLEGAIRGSGFNARQVFAIISSQLPTLFSNSPVTAGSAPVVLQEGTTLDLALPLRGLCQVRVADLNETSCVLLTVEGHPLNGAVKFEVTDKSDSEVKITIDTFSRSANMIDAAVMNGIGQVAQELTWHKVMGNIGQVVGGELEEVNRSIEEPEPGEASEVEAWLKELALKSRRQFLL